MLASVALAACGGEEPVAEPSVGLDAETFVETYIGLRQADYLATTPEEFTLMRDSILEHHATTQDELREFVREYSRDVDRMSALWDTIEVRIRRMARPDTTSA